MARSASPEFTAAAPPGAALPGRYAFLRESRWIGLIVAMIVASVICVFLGRWQWDRHHQRAAFAEQVATAYDSPVTDLPDLLGTPPAPVTGAVEWRRAELTGRYVEGSEVILRARPVDGTPAVHVLGLFEASASGGAPIDPLTLVVDRGWLPAALGDEVARGEAPMPVPPAGEVSLDARLRVAEEPDARAASPGIVLRIEPGLVLDAAGRDRAEFDTEFGPGSGTVLDGYAQAAAERAGGEEVAGGSAASGGTTAAGSPAPIRYARPSTDLGNNLSYAFQWWFFAVGAQLAWLLLARREADDREDELLLGIAPGTGGFGGHGAGHRHAPLPQGARSRPRARTLDDDVEDAALDRALGH